MNEELKVIISAEINKLKENVEKAKKEIESFKEKVEKASKDVDKKFKSLGDNIGKAVKTGTKAAAAAVASLSASFMAFTGAAIKNFAEYEQLVGGVEKLFGDSANVVKKYAEEAFKNAGVSANSYMSQITSFSASLISSLDGDTAKAAEIGNMAINDMADNANVFGTSLESIQNAYQGFAKQNYTMLDNLKLGYGGTKEEMMRLIDDANKVKKAMGENADLTIDSYADVIEAIHTMQKEMKITGTTAKEAEGTIAGAIGMTKAAIQNLITGIANGNADIPKLVSDVISSASSVLENIIPVVKEVLANIPVAISEISPEAGAAFQTVIDVLLVVLNNLKPILETAFTVIVNTINFVKDNQNVFVTVAALIGGIVTAIGLYNAVAAVKTAMAAAEVTTVWGLVTAYTAQAVAMIAAIAPYLLIIAAIAAVIAIIVLCVKHWDEIKEAVANAFEIIKEKVLSAIESIKGWLQTGFAVIKDYIINPIISAKNKVVDVFNNIKSAIVDKITSARDTVKGVVDKIKNFFNFKVSLPKIQLPHFSIKPKGWKLGDLLKGSIPSLGISWYAKGGVFDEPTLFSYGNSLGGLGEDGAEAIVPLEKNTEWLDKIADKLAQKQGVGNIVLQVDGKTFAEVACDSINDLSRHRGALPLILV